MYLSSAHHRGCKAIRGFTLVELIIVLVILGILGAYAVQNNGSPSELSLPSQAQKMASDIRYTQTLAHTTGQRMRLTITPGTNGTYSASCVSGSCSQAFSVTLKKNVILGGAPATIDFDTLGQPSAGASYTLKFGGSTKTVAVAPLTGFVTVTP